MTLRLKRLNGRDSPSVTAHISFYSYDNNYYLKIQTDDGLKLAIGDGAYQLLAILKPFIQSMEKSILGEQGPAILRGDAPPDDAGMRYINLDNRGRSYGLLIMSREFEQLPIKEKLLLLIERFKDSPAGIYEALLDDYRAAIGQRYKPVEADDSPQMQARLVLEKYDIEELVSADGSIVYGAKTMIANVIGVPVAGQSNIARIDAVLEQIKKINEATASLDSEVA